MGSGLARWAERPLTVCERGSAGSIGSRGSKGVGAAHKKQKRREGLKLAVFSYRKPNP